MLYLVSLYLLIVQNSTNTDFYPENLSSAIDKNDKIILKDSFLTMSDIAINNGFACESQHVLSSDNYVLSLYRIPGRLGEHQHDMNKPPIQMMHGLGADMMQWVGNGPDLSPALILAGKGQDVWMGNNRGTRFSLRHTTLDSNQHEQWKHTWEDLGTKDLPAFIDFIIKKTGFQKIAQIGHSQGTTQLMSAASLMPEYFNEKIKLAILIAPVAAMKNNRIELFRYLMRPGMLKILIFFMNSIKLWSFLPQGYLNSRVGVTLCKMQDGKLCSYIMTLFADENPEVNNNERISVFMSNVPSGSSMQNFIHFGQLVTVTEERFKRFDQGSDQLNEEKYGKSNPPDQDLDLINFPIGFISGSHDKLADPLDVAWTKTRLQKNIIFSKEYPIGHFGFVLSKDMSQFSIDISNLLDLYLIKNETLKPEDVTPAYSQKTDEGTDLNPKNDEKVQNERSSSLRYNN